MVRVPGLAPFTIKEHLPEERLQDAEPRETVPVPDWEKATVPVGTELPSLVTFTVQVEVEPMSIAEGVQETEVVVLVLAAVTVSTEDVPELPWLLESPL